MLSAPADRFVYALKYGGWPEVAGFMAARMVALLTPEERSGPWVLVPVPTTPSRQRTRGYNQAELLAREVARKTGLPLEHALQRKEGGGTQVALHRQERRANVEGAFEAMDGAHSRLRGRPVLLVDDVLTTGATGYAAADALTVGAAAARVRLITFARSLPQEDDVHP
ncbi:MAG: ComF family protein [Gemmatimonadales bacterium]|nr:MAG: ComF family protein [Gemmatimonadales bacterium]